MIDGGGKRKNGREKKEAVGRGGVRSKITDFTSQT